MSFKRDGDDYCALAIQRKHRVTELLYEDTSSEEVSKLRNGTYVCKLCHHKPIFDTLNMFHVHKHGKKHLASIERAEWEKQELADLIQKRKHESEPHTQQEETQSLGSKKPRMRANQRRRAIDLDLPNMDTTPTSSLPGNRNTGSHDNNYFKGSVGCGNHTNKKTTTTTPSNLERSDHVDNSFPGNRNANTSLSAHQPGNKKTSFLDNTATNRHSSNTHNSEADVTHKNIDSVVSGGSNISKFYAARRKQKQDVMKDVNDQLKGPVSSLSVDQPRSVYQSWDYYKHGRPGGSVAGPHNGCKKLHTDKPSGQPDKPGVCENGNAHVEKAAKAEQMLKAFGSGWKKDWTGNWVKDEGAEFDSDDEPPDV